MVKDFIEITDIDGNALPIYKGQVWADADAVNFIQVMGVKTQADGVVKIRWRHNEEKARTDTLDLFVLDILRKKYVRVLSYAVRALS